LSSSFPTIKEAPVVAPYREAEPLLKCCDFGGVLGIGYPKMLLFGISFT
jgi:hypothetical protein